MGSLISVVMDRGTPGPDELQVVSEEVLGWGGAELEDFKGMKLLHDVTEDISILI